MLMSVLCVPDITLQWLIQHSRTRRSWGGGAGVWLEEPHHVINCILGALDFILNKQASAPSFYSHKLIHIIYIVYFCFYLNVLFYGSSWSPDVSRDACRFAQVVLRVFARRLDQTSTDAHGIRHTGALRSRDSRRSVLRRHLVLMFFQRCENVPTCSEHSRGEFANFNCFSIR